ncbi:MAG: hypothetical protein ACNI25_16060 [Halarcobacter sp.]
MITIELTDEYAYGEPPPSFIWRGKPYDYIKLIKDLYFLGEQNGNLIQLSNLNYIDTKELNILLCSNNNANILNKIEGLNVSINLDANLWREIIEYFLSISFSPAHNYIDFDEYNLYEDANFIISSEG